MDVQVLGREAINRIKQQCGLPTSGFVAGGSIANIIWELVSGNKAVVNDIDIFILESVIEKSSLEEKKYFEYEEKGINYFEDYSGMRNYNTFTTDYYQVIDSKKDGIFNFISYKSNTPNQSIVIRSFDINSTRVGYSIDEDLVYYEPEFEEFLKTGILKVCNVITPSHTAMRIGKKSK